MKFFRKGSVKSGLFHPLGILLLLFSALGTVTAQSESGNSALEGTVKDSVGALVPGAAISIRNIDTGLERNALSNSSGIFNAPVLPVGRYTVSVKANGFAESRREVLLSVGETTRIDVNLQPFGASEEVIVLSEGELIDAESSATSSSITQKSIENLPIRGRNVPEFVQLVPGVIQEGDRKGLVIAGQRSINSNVAIDGADFNDALSGNQRGGNDAVFFFPQVAIKEFQVVRSGASAEVGRTGAGFVNAVTKGGTNSVRGEIFFQNRNNRFTSPDAFGNDGANNQNLVGGSLGGPIVRDRAFFFVGVERNFLRIPYFVKFQPLSSTLPPALAALEGEQISTNDPLAIFARTDFILNDHNTLNFQYTHSSLTAKNFIAIDEGITITNVAATQNVVRKGSSNGIKASLVTILSPDLINEFRGQIASDNRREDSNVEGPDIRISGIGRIGGSNSRPRIFNTLRYQVSDNLSWTSGNYRLKIGTDININRWEAQRVAGGTGTWRFNSLNDYLNLIPRRFDQAVPIFPEQLLASAYQKEFAFFIQNNFRIADNLRLTAGLRWEGLDNPTPPNPNPLLPETQKIPDDMKQWQPRLGMTWDMRGDGNSVLKVSSGIYTSRTPAIMFYRVFVNNDIVTKDLRIDERSGACRTATDPTLIPTNCYFRGTGALVTFPNTLVGLDNSALLPFTIRNGAALTRAFGFQPDFKNPRTYQGSITWEQKIGSDYVLSVGYLRSAAWNLQRRLDRNLNAPTISSTGFPVFPTNSSGGALRPNPNIGIYSINESSAHSSYDALAISLRRRFAQRFQLEANYTLAENRDDDSNERNFSKEGALNPFDLKIEAGPSKQDVRHNFNVSGVFDLGAGFSVSSILITRSGFPYTPRPIDGEDYQNDGNDANDRAIVNGVVVGRHSGRGPNFLNLDLRLLKTFSLGEKRSLALSAEVFNMTKASNKSFGVDAYSDYCTTNSSLVSTSNPMNITCPSGTNPSILAAEPYTAPSTARFGGPRQLQLGLRFQF